MVVAVSAATGPDDGRVVALWSPPRCMSTALFRVMAERGDLTVAHEPFCELAAVGRFALGDREVRSQGELLDVLFQEAKCSTVYFKDTTEYRHRPVLEDDRALRGIVHTFLIRDPGAAIPSHYAINPQLTSPEVGYEHLHEIFEAARQALGGPPIVLEAEDLQQRPEATVRAYCDALGIPFLPHALEWERGPRKEWERTGRWHLDVSASTGIEQRAKQYAVRTDNDPLLAAFERHHRPFYEALRQHRLPVARTGQVEA